MTADRSSERGFNQGAGHTFSRHDPVTPRNQRTKHRQKEGSQTLANAEFRPRSTEQAGTDDRKRVIADSLQRLFRFALNAQIKSLGVGVGLDRRIKRKSLRTVIVGEFGNSKWVFKINATKRFPRPGLAQSRSQGTNHTVDLPPRCFLRQCIEIKYRVFKLRMNRKRMSGRRNNPNHPHICQRLLQNAPSNQPGGAHQKKFFHHYPRYPRMTTRANLRLMSGTFLSDKTSHLDSRQIDLTTS